MEHRENKLLRVHGHCVEAGDDVQKSSPEIEFLALIDFADGHRRALLHLSSHHGVGARSGKYEAQRNGRFCHQGGPIIRAIVNLWPVVVDRVLRVNWATPAQKTCRRHIDKSEETKTQSLPT